MRRTALVLVFATLGLAGCGQVSMEDDPIGSSRTDPASSSTTPVVTGPAPTPVPSGATTPTTVTTARPITTTTTRPLSRAEATSRLCTAVAEADERIQRGDFLAGGLRLGGGVSANQQADPAVVSAARGMLRAGIKGDSEAYVAARPVASAACARAGHPIRLSGLVQCVTTPCP